jgi:hypothetical protein
LEITRGRFHPFDLLAYGATLLERYFGEQRLARVSRNASAPEL